MNTDKINEPVEHILKLSAITVDPSIQCRAALNQETVVAYGERMKAGDKFPALDVFQIDKTYLLSDGFHRHPAAKAAGLKEFAVKIHQGTRKDAVKFAIQANSSHGLPRTNQDKRRAVELALTEFPDLSDRAVAEMCKVSHVFVLKLRPQLVTVTSCEQRIGRDGKKRKLPSRDSATLSREKPKENTDESSEPPCHTAKSQPQPDEDNTGGPVNAAKAKPAQSEQSRAEALL